MSNEKTLREMADEYPILKQLVEKQQEYIKFLGDEIKRTASYLICHGMGCSTGIIDQGIELREQMEQLKSRL